MTRPPPLYGLVAEFESPSDLLRAAEAAREAGYRRMVQVQAAAREQTLAGYVREFPFPVTREVLRRGQERYDIFCVVCHGPTGLGDGKIVERGFTRPPSFVTDDSRGFKYRGFHVPLRDAPAGYYYEVISKGFGAMPDYAAQVPPRDRWAIVAYVRALQLSQHARLADLPANVRQAATSQLEGPHERGSEPSQ